MTTPVSTADTAATNLQTIVTAAVADVEVLVQLDITFDEQGLPDDVVSIGAIDRAVENLNQVGGFQYPGSLAETYTVEVVISVFRGGDDPAAVRARAFQLLAAAETAVRADPTLTGAVHQAVPAKSRYEPSWSEDGKGRIGTQTLLVQCWAQI